MKLLLERGYLHGDCMTVTGQTVAENLAELPGLAEGQQVVVGFEQPIKDTGESALSAESDGQTTIYCCRCRCRCSSSALRDVPPQAAGFSRRLQPQPASPPARPPAGCC
eukprot:COSAG01_NODE_44509_length_418_cov_1.216301_1_plen_109_part_01